MQRCSVVSLTLCNFLTLLMPFNRICWPFDLDQPAAAKNLTENLNVAFELIEVRTGLGLKPILSTGKTPKGTQDAVGTEMREVIDQCHGEIGQEKRKNVLRIKSELAKAWEHEGIARAAIREFIQTLQN